MGHGWDNQGMKWSRPKMITKFDQVCGSQQPKDLQENVFNAKVKKEICSNTIKYQRCTAKKITAQVQGSKNPFQVKQIHHEFGPYLGPHFRLASGHKAKKCWGYITFEYLPLVKHGNGKSWWFPMLQRIFRETHPFWGGFPAMCHIWLPESKATKVWTWASQPCGMWSSHSCWNCMSSPCASPRRPCARWHVELQSACFLWFRFGYFWKLV